ncbi:MAG: Protein of unknown function (DUF3987)/DnaB-like helicase terminal domain [Mycobacterium sp.]|nr:Protein of unknown function (DUF3987)/DnaB-like helicase terminal domain [Mycobacterium sp.]
MTTPTDIEQGWPDGSTPQRVDPAAAEWLEPDPLDDPVTAPRAPFPTEHMPTVFRDMIRAVASNKQVPEDLPALLGLSCVAVLAGPRAAINRGNGWVEPLNLYTCVAMDSGTGKTPAEKDVIKAIKRIQKNMTAGYREWADREVDRLDMERSGAALKGKDGAAEANRIEDEIKRLKDTRDTAHPRLLYGSDTTIETLAIKMAENGDHAGIIDSEGEFFDLLAGRYSNGTPNIGLALKAYDADWYDTNRVTRATKPLHRAILTLGLGTQPSALAEVSRDKTMVGRGLLNRFLFAVPHSLLGTREDEGTWYDHEAMAAWSDQLARIAEIKVPAPDIDEDDFPMLELMPEALQRHKEFRAWIEKRLPDGGELGDMPGWAAKHTGRVLRIAGLLHLIAGKGVDDKVRERSMFAATKVAEWAIPHARIVFGYDGASVDEGTERCHQVLAWIRFAQPEEFVSRDACRGVRKSWVSAVSMVEVLDELAGKGWLRQVTRRDKSNRVKVAYLPHPSLIGGAQ